MAYDRRPASGERRTTELAAELESYLAENGFAEATVTPISAGIEDAFMASMVMSPPPHAA
jgi:hypothetical protein